MEILKIVTQSIEDAENGKPVVEGITLENTKQTKDFTVGILEGGTKGGATSLMFCLKFSDNQFAIAEMTGNHLEALYHAYQGAKARFGK